MTRPVSATPSPYARTVRIALAEKAIPFDVLALRGSFQRTVPFPQTITDAVV